MIALQKRRDFEPGADESFTDSAGSCEEVQHIGPFDGSDGMQRVERGLPHSVARRAGRLPGGSDQAQASGRSRDHTHSANLTCAHDGNHDRQPDARNRTEHGDGDQAYDG